MRTVCIECGDNAAAQFRRFSESVVKLEQVTLIRSCSDPPDAERLCRMWRESSSPVQMVHRCCGQTRTG